VEFTELFGNLSKDVVSDMDAMKLFDLIDVNGDEKIEFDEFMAIFKETTSTNDMILIEYMFKCIDKDNSGTIETEEIKKFVEDNKVVFSKDELNKLVARIDADNSGSVDINEFKQALFEEFKKLEY
jgi:Ca2+-binding EF-hand superfamily protein